MEFDLISCRNGLISAQFFELKHSLATFQLRAQNQNLLLLSPSLDFVVDFMITCKGYSIFFMAIL